MLPSPNGISFFEKSLPSYLLLPVVAVSKDETFCLTKIIRRKKKVKSVMTPEKETTFSINACPPATQNLDVISENV